MRIKSNYSENFSKKTRNAKHIQFIIIHYTGMQSARVSINRLKNSKAKVSCHYLIDRNGGIFKIVKENKVAWHAGKSRWKNLQNLNQYSLGIELQNKGHSIGYQNFPKNQIKALTNLMKILMKKYKIKKQNVLGHSDVAPLRKMDPGERFPWKLLAKKSLAIWYLGNKLVNYYDVSEKNKRKIFFKNIHKLGYRYFKLSKKSKEDKLIIKAFQRRFLPNEVSGKLTNKTLQISHKLAN